MKLKYINVCVILLTVTNHSQSASVRGTGEDDYLVDIKGNLEEISLSLSRLLFLVNSLTTSPAPLSSTTISTELPHASSTPLPPETSGDSSAESTTDFRTDTATYSSAKYSTDFPTKMSTYLTTFEVSTQLSSDSSTHQAPAESSTFPTVESSTFSPAASSTFPTVESSTFSLAESSTFPTVESSTFPTVESSTFPNVESSTFSPAASSTFPIAESSTFPPTKSSTFPTVESSTFSPAESSTFPTVESFTFPNVESSTFSPAASSTFPTAESSTFPPTESSTFSPAESSTFPVESSTSTESSLLSAELSTSVELSSLPPKPLTHLSTKPSNLPSESLFLLSTKTTGYLTDKSPAPVLAQLPKNQLIEHSTDPSTQSTTRSSTGKSTAELTHLSTEKQRTESSIEIFIDSTETLLGFASIQLATDWSIPTQNEAKETSVEKATELSSGVQAVILPGSFNQQSGESSTDILAKSSAELPTKQQDARAKNALANAQFCTSRYKKQNLNHVTAIKTSGGDLCKRLSSALDDVLRLTRKIRIDLIKEEERKELQECSDDLEESVIGVEQDPLFIYAIDVEVFNAYLKGVDKSVDEAKAAVEEKLSTFPTWIAVVSSIGGCFASAVLVFGGVLIYWNKNYLMCRSQ